ncbi:50S ribosomal protein L22 [Desulfurococcus mucosus]|uniref:Large ribosomal subunit protein uL22 n=1 Tax=Desulfurococcus mucosus (strain ATCC 35584 / DSM 2162 / JCM 9187 / O7/1) TaxID=765177 RepID=E8RAN5_DESM0|nr:50S ribosomal protein L22 [Desulfurococcus mucosus]ADV65471.1 LSU ribosomal protein L22P [Desulfurococcus mucosus DSM 2162]
MPTWHYSVKYRDESKIAKAVRYDIPVSVKYMREIAYTLKGMRLSDAIRFLEDVIKMKQAVPFRRYNGKLSHKRGLADRFKWPIGRYPVKGAKYALEVLRNVEANAEEKGLSKERLVIVHIAAHKGITLKRYMPRAFGRATPKFRRMSNLEVVVGEVG